MRTREREFFDWLVPGTCAELLAAYGVGAERRAATSPTEKPETCSGGVLSFASPQMSGTLLLVGSFKFMADCRPVEARARKLVMSSAADWILVRDWSMELANQLFGRIRNRLYAWNVTLDVKSPTAVSGASLAVAMRSRTNAPYEFRAAGDQTIRVWFEASLSPDFELGVRRDSSNFPKEGDTIVF